MKKKYEIGIEYRQKYGMQMPTLTLARIMYNENIELFIIKIFRRQKR